jgi:uncharacterized protein (DUF1800 family)
MITTPTPVTEAMTLFWHNHFTSSVQKTRSPLLMYRQNLFLRTHALGNYADMLRDVIRDPAMLVYLDTVRSRDDAPNENFARELLELFTLGPGHYSEQDIKEIARAFTGYSIELQSGVYTYRARIHDDGPKTVLGETGDFDGDDVVKILLDHPRTAETVVEKAWRHFVSDEPDSAEVARISGIFRNSGYEIKAMLSALLGADAFWASENRAGLIKSPVDLVVGTMRQLDIVLPDMRFAVLVSRQLGQDIFDPPNVKGWAGGADWITSETLLLRNDFVRAVSGIDSPPSDQSQVSGMRTGRGGAGRLGSNRPGPDASPMERQVAAMNTGMLAIGNRSQATVDEWINGLNESWRNSDSVAALLLAAAPADLIEMETPVTSDLVRSLLIDPVYQLK